MLTGKGDAALGSLAPPAYQISKAISRYEPSITGCGKPFKSKHKHICLIGTKVLGYLNLTSRTRVAQMGNLGVAVFHWKVFHWKRATQ